MRVTKEIRLPELAKALDLLHYWFKPAPKPVEKHDFRPLFLLFLF
jgi:hypothetical protein